MAEPVGGRNRVVIERVTPEIDCGRFPIKRIVGDVVVVEADVFADGHDEIAARLLYLAAGDGAWKSVSMQPLGNDRWRASFQITKIGNYTYTIAASVDRFRTWRRDMRKRLAVAQDVSVELRTGAQLVEDVARRAQGQDAIRLAQFARQLKESGAKETAGNTALDADLASLMSRYPDPSTETHATRELSIVVDRERARFSAWYEMFPRSASRQIGQHGTLKDCEDRLDYIADLGFDVLYLPPIHPIGRSFRKGKNNSAASESGDVGSPWAIGSTEGGHTAIHPDLGSMDDFESLRNKAKQAGLELAMDIAFQCSPDHPWVEEHPGWFRKRADGTIQYAENPPKKYQDIYPLDFESDEWWEMWQALRDVFLFWGRKGIRIFRVDNPHTKAFPFWEWVIGEIKQKYPETIFLAEAFTRLRVMSRLAKLGFSQSYTYFTWRNTSQELTDYFRELAESDLSEYFRPNLWPNTPDILPESLQVGGVQAFMSRLALAATLSGNYGIYGPAFEEMEATPREQWAEEYLNSEKYEIKQWKWNGSSELPRWIKQVNQARRSNRALQDGHRLHFHETDNPSLLCYSKESVDGSNLVLCVVNLDPFHTHSGWLSVDMAVLGVDPAESYQLQDQLSNKKLLWQGARNYIELRDQPACIFTVLKRTRSEKDFDYYL
jgi:starch synthase (maltosyl-transferring)